MVAIVVSAVVVYLVIYSGFTYFLYTRRVSRKTQLATKRFFEEVDRQLDFGLITNLQDVVRIQRSIANEVEAPTFEGTDIKRILEAYLLRVSGSDIDPEQLRKRFEFFKELLSQEALAILPEAEQAIVERLNQDIQKGDQDETLRHLRELVSSVGARYQTLSEQISRNRTWTKIGAIGGILGIVVAIITWSLSIQAI